MRSEPRPARPSDLQAALHLLVEAGLPLGGIEERFPAGYVVVEASGALLGLAGLETYGGSGLLRSVAVRTAARSQGLARSLVQDRLEAAAAQSIQAVYLLTTTAAPYFAGLGFEAVDRAKAPAPLQASAEFASICPASAVCMRRSLV